jgi:hypothetical protein
MASPNPNPQLAQANAQIAQASSGLSKLKAQAVGMAGELVTPMMMLARGATVTQAAFEGVKASIVARVLGPVGAVSGAALGLIGVVKVLTRTFGRLGVEVQAPLERIEKQFLPLLRSVTAVKQRMRELQEFSAKSPFNFPSVAQGNKTLETLTRGMLSTKAGMKLVGDAAAVSGADFDEVAMAVGRVYAGIRNGEPFERYATRLEAMGLVSSETIKRLGQMEASGGETDAMWRLMEQDLRRAEGGMAALSGTVEGLRARLADAKQSAAAAFGQGFMEGEKDSLEASAKAAEALTPVYEALGQTLGILPNLWAKAKREVVEFVAGLKFLVPVAVTAAYVIGILAISVAGVAVLRVMGFFGQLIALMRGTAVATAAAADATKALAAVRLLLAEATGAAAAGELRLALVSLRAAGAQAIAIGRTNGLQAALVLLKGGLTAVWNLLRMFVGGILAGLATGTGILLSVTAALGLALVNVIRTNREFAAAAREAADASRAQTAAIREQVAAMVTAEDKARVLQKAYDDLANAEADENKPMPTWQGLVDSAYGTGEQMRQAKSQKTEQARQNLAMVQGVPSSALGEGEERRQQRVKLSVMRQGARFGENVTLAQAVAEWEAKGSTQRALRGEGPEGERLGKLVDDREKLRRNIAGSQSRGHKPGAADVEDLDWVNRQINQEQRNIRARSGSEEMRLSAPLEAAQRRIDLVAEANRARETLEKVVGAGDDKKKLGALAGGVSDATLRDLLERGHGEGAQSRATELWRGINKEAAALPAVTPAEMERMKSAKDEAAQKYDLQRAHETDLARFGAEREAKRAAGEEKVARLRDDSFESAMRELVLKNEALALEEEITSQKLAQGELTEKAAAAARAHLTAQRAANEKEIQLQTKRTEETTRRATLDTRAQFLDRQSAEARRNGRHADADRLEKESQAVQLASRRIELEREVLSLSEAELKARGYAGKSDYVEKKLAEERAAMEQQREWRKEDIALSREKAAADVEAGEGDFAGKVATMGGDRLRGRRITEEAQRRGDEARRQELTNQYMRDLRMLPEEAAAMAGQKIKVEQAVRQLDAMGDQRGSVVASSLATIGGGGGVAGLDPVTNRLDVANQLLREIRDKTVQNTRNVFG